MELDQAGVDRAACGDARRAAKPSGGSAGGVLDANELVVGDVHGAAIEHRPVVVDRDDTAGQDVAVGHQGVGFGIAQRDA